jgi:hypothetical protein
MSIVLRALVAKPVKLARTANIVNIVLKMEGLGGGVNSYLFVFTIYLHLLCDSL